MTGSSSRWLPDGFDRKKRKEKREVGGRKFARASPFSRKGRHILTGHLPTGHLLVAASCVVLLGDDVSFSLDERFWEPKRPRYLWKIPVHQN
jgi:hypothetical protein